MKGGREKGRRAMTAAEREAMEWREFDHRQQLDAATQRLDADTSLVRLGPATRSEPGAGRAVRVTVPGRERVAKRVVHMVGIEDGRAVYEETELQVPTERQALAWEPELQARRSQVHVGRELVMRLPRSWQPDDVLGWLAYARAVIGANERGDGAPIASLSGMARLMAAYAEPQASLVNSRWIPMASEVTLAEWIVCTWLPWLTHRVERVAVALHVRGVSLRKIGPAIGFAAADTNHTKSVIRKGLWRIGCKLDAMGLEGWPRLREMRLALDERD